MNKISSAGNRLLHIDLLRVLTIFTVIFQHGSRQGPLVYIDTNGTAEYWISLFLSLFGRYAVPIFFMISGALLLGREESIKTLYRKRILRMVIVFFAISAVYFVAYHWHYDRETLGISAVWQFLHDAYEEPITAPLWYLYSYIAALVMLPFLRKLAKLMEAKDYFYLLLLRLVFVTGVAILDNFVFRTTLTDQFQIPIAAERSLFYMLMGYFIEHKIPAEKFTKKNACILWSAALFFIFLCMGLTHLVNLRDGRSTDTSLVLYDKFAAFSALALYFSAKAYTMHHPISDKVGKAFTALAGNVFGIYLMEKALRELFMPVYNRLLPVLTTLPTAFLWTLCCVVCGEIVVGLARKIPFVRKLIG